MIGILNFKMGTIIINLKAAVTNLDVREISVVPLRER
jgi:hypothetical protein